MFSNAISAAELFEGNASSPRLEVAWLGYRPEAGWFFKLRRAGEPVVEFAQAADAGSPSTCELVGLEPNVLQSGESGEQAVARLCQHFEICRPMPAIRILDDGFQIISAAGRPVNSGLRGYVRLDGPAIREGDTEAAVALANAIKGCDPDGIREAVRQGASLTSPLPDSSFTPLFAALYKFGEPGWDACVELLLDLGCPVDGVKKDPPIVACAADDVLGPKTVKLLVAHGADVNAANREGTTAIFESVIKGRVGLARFLMQHGADPTIKNWSGTSALEWLRKQYGEETGFRSRTKYAELLSVVSGQPVAKPEVPALRPELQAENDRFKRCLKSAAADRIDAHGIRAEAREGLATRQDELVSRLAERVAQRGLSALRALCTLDATSERLRIRNSDSTRSSPVRQINRAARSLPIMTTTRRRE